MISRAAWEPAQLFAAAARRASCPGPQTATAIRAERRLRRARQEVRVFTLPADVEPDAARAGAGRVTLAVAGLDALLERLTTEGIEHEPIETYPNGVRYVKVPDPDGNVIALAELPQS